MKKPAASMAAQRRSPLPAGMPGKTSAMEPRIKPRIIR